MGNTIELTKEWREHERLTEALKQAEVELFQAKRAAQQPQHRRRLDLYTLLLVVVGIFAGRGIHDTLIIDFGWSPVLPGVAVSAAQAAELAESEQLKQFDEAAKRVKKPEIKSKG